MSDDINPQRDYPSHGERKGRGDAAADVALLRAHIETQRDVLRKVLAVLDGSGEFQCGSKGRDLLLREQIRALVTS